MTGRHNKRRPVLLAFLLALVTWIGGAQAEDVYGRVVAISDGDTFTLLTARREQLRVRLSAIDAPERGQPYGEQAREALAHLVLGRQVRVDVHDIDRFGRAVGRVYVGGSDVCAEMVRTGAAWVFRRYSDDPHLLRLESYAQQARRGLWGLPEAQRLAPWDWRSAVR